MVPAVTELQRANARLAAAYLAGFIAVETGKRTGPKGLSASADAVGVNQAGRPIEDSLKGSLFTVKKAISDGHPVEAALGIGVAVAQRSAGEDVMFAGRDTVSAGIRDSDQITGWRRVTGGGCGACLAAADGRVFADEDILDVHPFCQCSAEPVVRDAPDTVARLTGEQMFHALAKGEQDQLLGPDRAQIMRDGDVPFHALIERQPMAAIPDVLTEAPLEALRTHHH